MFDYEVVSSIFNVHINTFFLLIAIDVIGSNNHVFHSFIN